MPIEISDVPKRKDSEKNRIIRIKEFLEKNQKAYTSQEISDLTGIKCAEVLLGWKQEEFVKELGIKKTDIIVERENKYCGSEYYYWYEAKPKMSKMPKKSFWSFLLWGKNEEKHYDK